MGRLGLWRLYPFEALAEISDFAAGLVHRVPKKPIGVKADLQNSTASQGDCGWESVLCRAFGYGSKMLPLRGSIRSFVVVRLTAKGGECSTRVNGSRLLPLQM